VFVPLNCNVPVTVGFVIDGVDIDGPVARTTAPLPVAVLKSVYPASQSAAVVSVVPIQVHIAVVPERTDITKFPPELFTVTVPVELLQIWNDHPVCKVDVTGRTTVCVVEPVNN